MSHTTNSPIRIIHPNGQHFATVVRAERIVRSGGGYYRDLAKTTVVILSPADDKANPNYEYVGKHSCDRFAVKAAIDPRTNLVIQKPIEVIDRTLIPVRQSGGQKVMQLAPLRHRRARGTVGGKEDRLWHPSRRK